MYFCFMSKGGFPSSFIYPFVLLLSDLYCFVLHEWRWREAVTGKWEDLWFVGLLHPTWQLSMLCNNYMMMLQS